MKRLSTVFLVFTALLGIGCNSGNGPKLELCGTEVELMGGQFKGYDRLGHAKACAKSQNRPLFVMFSLSWANSNRGIEDKIFRDKEVIEHLTQNFIPVILYVDDRRELPLWQQYEDEINGHVWQIKTFGRLNGITQIKMCYSNGTPIYTILDPSGRPLIEPWGYTRDPDVFVQKFEEALKILSPSEPVLDREVDSISHLPHESTDAPLIAINQVTFSLDHSIRIPYHKVRIRLSKYDEYANIEVKSIPMAPYEERWAYTARDSAWTISLNSFKQIVQGLIDIDADGRFNRKGIRKKVLKGKDGTMCTLTYGNATNFLTYRAWSPDFETQERHLTLFLEKCKSIIELAGFDPKEVL